MKDKPVISYSLHQNDVKMLNSLKELVQKHNLGGSKVHFFSLDVEGCELQVLDGLDLSINRPLYIHVETSNFKNRQEDMMRYMHKYNYSFVERISDNDDLYISNS